MVRLACFRLGIAPLKISLRGNIARTALPKTNLRNCPRFSGIPVPQLLKSLSANYRNRRPAITETRTRSSLHRCLHRHGISRLPEVEGDKPIRKTFRSYPIGYFHIDIAEVQTAEGKLRLFVAIDRTSKFAYAELHQEAGKMVAAQFLRNLIAAVPYAIHTVLTDNVLRAEGSGAADQSLSVRQHALAA